MGRWLKRAALLDGVLLPDRERGAEDPVRVLDALALRAAAAERLLRDIEGSSSAMQQVRCDAWAGCFGGDLGSAVWTSRALRDVNVLITGEPGVGKELVARALSVGSPVLDDGRPGAVPAYLCRPRRHEGFWPRHPRSALNISAIPDTLVEYELFGILAGVATSVSAREGHLALAHRGVLFIDEIGDLELEHQAALLRVMQESRGRATGAPPDQDYSADIRYIGTTHKSPDDPRWKHEFRPDFLSRLRGVHIHLPPLRERPEDIAQIAMRFAVDEEVRGRVPGSIDVEGRVARWLDDEPVEQHPWTGNVRELQGCVRRVVAGIPTRLRPDDHASVVPSTARVGSLRDRLEALLRHPDWAVAQRFLGEKELLRAYQDMVLRVHDGNVAKAARALGVSHTTLHRRLVRQREA